MSNDQSDFLKKLSRQSSKRYLYKYSKSNVKGGGGGGGGGSALIFVGTQF